MRVGNQDRIHAVDLMTLGVHRIALHPGIHHNDFARLQAKLQSRMTEPGDLYHSCETFPTERRNGNLNAVAVLGDAGDGDTANGL